MKKTHILLACAIICICGCKQKSSKNAENSSSVETQTTVQKEATNADLKLIEEYPELREKTVDAGRIKMSQNGYSIGKKTEMTILRKQLETHKFDKITVRWVWDCSPNYSDIPMEIVFNNKNGKLSVVYRQNNVKEDYYDITEDGLIAYLKSGAKNFDSISKYCKDAKYDFNNREMTNHAKGEMPEQSKLDGSVKIVKNYVKSIVDNPSSLKFIEWTKISSIGDNWVVRAKYSYKDNFNQIIIINAWYYIQNSKVVDMKIII